jgi:uncharacterized membrane protein
MSTIVLLVIVGAVAGAITYILMKKGTIADVNNNNVPDAIEEKVEEVKAVVKENIGKARRNNHAEALVFNRPWRVFT